jgi:hypothetical protein
MQGASIGGKRAACLGAASMVAAQGGATVETGTAYVDEPWEHTIMIVDDDPSNLHILEALLQVRITRFDASLDVLPFVDAMFGLFHSAGNAIPVANDLM